jgi:hypothetical protein
MIKHTPGPWYALAEGVADAAIGYRAVIDSDGYTVCNPSPMGEANARLIAAAPDMYALLRDVVALLDNPDADQFDADKVERRILDILSKVEAA